MSALISQDTWGSLDEATQLRLVRALQIRYQNGQKPTYKATGPVSVGARGRSPGEVWKTMALHGDETFSPAAIISIGDTFDVTMVPLCADLLARKVQMIKVGIRQCLAHFEGFALQLTEMAEHMEGEMLDEMRAKSEADERARASEARHQAQFTASDEWGAF